MSLSKKAVYAEIMRRRLFHRWEQVMGQKMNFNTYKSE